MHQLALEYVKSHTDGRWKNVVEFGGRNINGSVREWIDAGDYLSIDVVDGAGVDLVADAAEWDGDAKYDLVVCCEVLEHTKAVAEILASAGRALRPGGTFVLTAACDPREGHSAIDGAELRDGEYYRNLKPADLKVTWGDVADIEWDRTAGDVRATIVKHRAKHASSPAKKTGPARKTPAKRQARS